LNRIFAWLMGIIEKIWAEIQRIIEKILESLGKTKRKASRKRLLGHQFFAFFIKPHRFGRCKAGVEGVTEKTMPSIGTCRGAFR